MTMMKYTGNRSLYLFVLVCIVSCGTSFSASTSDKDEHEEVHSHQVYAVLFPWFCQLLGIVFFYVMTRKLHAIPYSCLMFLIGTAMGAGAVSSGAHDQLTQSILMWSKIDSHVLFLVFLPGLLFRDAFLSNFHLFMKSIPQIFVLAFPAVLAGTCLTAIVGKYFFPYDWSWNLAMTFGSILSATDPVAVAALLNELGAPPRLKIHISGESMFNDGSAMVFFTICSNLFLSELGEAIGVDDVGTTYNVGSGFVTFFRMSLGGIAIGICFAAGLIMLLSIFQHRLEGEENVIQVTCTITIAYLAFYTAEVALSPMSGILAVVTCGLGTRAVAAGMINNDDLMENFWFMLEHLLNTLLFGLGGVVWGEVIQSRDWGARDWGYLFLLYVCVIVIRFILLFGFYPINSRIGLKSNWKETFFASWAGLRGAVGIALAISLDHNVQGIVDNIEDAKIKEQYEVFVSKLFGMVGGITLLTLIINGVTSGPLLKKLELTKSTETREKYVHSIEKSFVQHVLNDFVYLMSYPRFHMVNFAAVRYHVPVLKDVTKEDIEYAVEVNMSEVPADKYRPPRLDLVYSFLDPDYVAPAIIEDNNDVAADLKASMMRKLENVKKSAVNEDELKEVRLTYIELVRSAYLDQVRRGELDSRTYNGFLYYCLLQSLEFAKSNVSLGKPLSDWHCTQIVANDFISKLQDFFYNLKWKEIRKRMDGKSIGRQNVDILRAMAFISAHRMAQENFIGEFSKAKEEFTQAEKMVLEESMAEVAKAEKELTNCDGQILRGIISHHFCVVLLNKFARHVEKLLEEGLLTDQEAHHILHKIDKSIIHCTKSQRLSYPGNDDDEGEEGKSNLSADAFMRGLVSEMTMRGHIGSAFKKMSKA